MSLVETGVFDLLFLLETWHVDSAARRSHPRMLAATELDPLDPNDPPLKGRRSGGVALLVSSRGGAAAAASPEPARVSPLGDALTVFTDRGAFSGVYALPSLPEACVARLLDSLSPVSDVILGDFNVRFPRLSCQHGVPGPRARLDVFREWLALGSFVHTLPDPSSTSRDFDSRLTVDHCFSRRSFGPATLTLPRTVGLGLDTDHRYALSLSVGSSLDPLDAPPVGSPPPTALPGWPPLRSRTTARCLLCVGAARRR